MLEINDVLRCAPESTTVIEGIARFLGVDSQHSAYLIRLDRYPIVGPFKVPMAELMSAIQEEAIILDHDIELDLPPTLELASAASKKKTKQAMDLLLPLIEDDDVLFDSDCRGRVFAKREAETGISARNIRRLYYKYLWGGMTELGLIPQFALCGGVGNEQKPGSERRGRKGSGNSIISQVPLPEVRKKLEKGAQLFYFPGQLTVKEAYMETKKKYFSNGALISQKSKVSEFLPPQDQLPSERQFHYVCTCLQKKLGKTVKKIARRIRQETPDWEFRGRSRDDVPGPGYRFEIDATKIQVRLVSRYNRARTLTSPTLYIIIDVWSGTIVGYALSLHNESWALAARALHNCFTDKQEVFDRLGLDYTSEDWCCHHLPRGLCADRGSMVSDKAGVVPGIGIKVEITPPMCPELKGKVESSIKNVKHGHSYQLPGRYAKFRQRRETDGTDTAALKIDELEKIIVEIIMGLNEEPVPIKYLPPEIIEDGETDMSHINLYRWGLKHRFGYTRKLDATEVYTHLMTTGVATLTSRGLYFNNQTFTSPDLAKVKARKRSSGKGNPQVSIRYDEHRATEIWFLNSETTKWVVAINDDENVRRRKAAFYELEDFRIEVEKLRSETKDNSLHRNGERRKKIKVITKQAVEVAKEDRKGGTRSSRRKNMRENAQLEKDVAAMISSGATVSVLPPSPAVQDTDPAPLPHLELDSSPVKQDDSSAQASLAISPQESIAQRSKNLWRLNDE